MKRALLLIVWLGGVALAGPDWVLSEKEQDPVPVKPQATFDAAQAKRLLGPGPCRLDGVASFRFPSGLFQKKKPQQHPPAGSKIYLFPYTPYTEEVVKLFKEYTPKKMEQSMDVLMAEMKLRALTGQGLPQFLPKKRIEVNPAFPKIWLGALTDTNGQFHFEHLQPGRYFLQSVTFQLMRGVTYDVQVGEDVEEVYWSNGEVERNSYPVWAQESTTLVRQIELVGIVDLPAGTPAVSFELDEDWDDFHP